MATPNIAALQALLNMKSSTNMTAGPDDFVNKRRAQILGGDDALAPSQGELEAEQAQGGYTDSQDQLRDTGIDKLKKFLGLQQVQHQQEMEKVTAPEQIRGQYGLKEAEANANATANLHRFSEDQQNQRQAASEANQNARTDKMIEASAGRQQAGFDNKAGQIPPAIMNRIAQERQMLEASVNKTAPGMLGKFLGHKSPSQPQLDAFDTGLAWAQRINRELGPNVSAEDALQTMGATNADPNEIGQINKFLMMIRGH